MRAGDWLMPARGGWGARLLVADVYSKAELEERLRQAAQSLAERERFIEQVNSTAPAIIYIYDVIEQRNVYSNDGIERVLGFSPDTVREMGSELFAKILHPDDFPAVLEHQGRLAGAADGEVLSLEYRMKNVHDRWRTLQSFESIFARSDDGAPKQTAGVAIDVTERRSAERELREATEALRRSNRDLEQFASAASHDLQEPLRMIASFLQLLQADYGDRLDDKANEFIEIAVDGATRMRRLVSDLLEYAQVDARPGPVEACDVGHAVDNALMNLRVAIAESGAQVQVDELPNVPADETQLTQLFQNLIGNAVKFRGDAQPRIRVTAARSGSEWEFAVSDEGIGVAPEYADKIFMIFERLHGREEYGGTGIGLAMCARIVERHGGTIWLDTAAGEGTTIRFSLPAAD